MALHPKFAARLSLHVRVETRQAELEADQWLAANHLEPGPVDVPLGAHRRWDPPADPKAPSPDPTKDASPSATAIVLDELVKIYKAAGWSGATASDTSKGCVLHLDT